MQINIGHFTTLLKPHNIGTHLKGIETSFTTLLKPHNIGTHLKGIETSFTIIFEILPLLGVLSLFEIFSKYIQSFKGSKHLLSNCIPLFVVFAHISVKVALPIFNLYEANPFNEFHKSEICVHLCCPRSEKNLQK
jgi:hypothetical protein